MKSLRHASRKLAHHLVEFDFASTDEGDQKTSDFVYVFCLCLAAGRLQFLSHLELNESSRLFDEQELLLTVWKHAYQQKTQGDIQRYIQSKLANYDGGLDFCPQESRPAKDEPMEGEDQPPQ